MIVIKNAFPCQSFSFKTVQMEKILQETKNCKSFKATQEGDIPTKVVNLFSYHSQTIKSEQIIKIVSYQLIKYNIQGKTVNISKTSSKINVSVHSHINQPLVIQIFKVSKGLAPNIFASIFETRNKMNCKLASFSNCSMPFLNSVYNELKLSFR